MGRGRPSKSLSLACVAISALLIGVATLFPSSGRATEELRVCILCGERAVADALTNVALFAPLGASLTLSGIPRSRVLLWGTLLSSLVELAQLGIPGRDSSIGDVLSNAVGTGAGALLVVTAAQWLRPVPRLERLLFGGWTALAAGVAWATALLLQPVYPSSTYYGLWTPDLGHLEWYRGRVLAAQVGNMPVPAGRADRSERLRAELEAQHPILVRATAGPATPGLSALFGITDDRQREVVLIGPDRDDLVYRFRSRATALGFSSPDIRGRGLLQGVGPGDSLTVEVSFDRRGICLVAQRGRACGSWPGPEAGWTLLYFRGGVPAWPIAVLNAAWLALLAAPVGYWSPGKRAMYVFGGALLLAVLGASAYSGTVSAVSGLSVIMGSGLGSLARAYARAPRHLTGGPRP